MNTPVVLLTFNRPDLTRRVLEDLRTVRPPALFVSSDGPRPGRPEDPGLVGRVRALVDELIDWPCEVVRDFMPQNEGCGRRVASALTRAFSIYEEAIVLEDDCAPHPSFFPFCEALLERYRHDTRVMHIGGTNFWADRHRPRTSYVFSRYAHVWGWATWRRAWSRFDSRLSTWPDVRRRGLLSSVFYDDAQASYWSDVFDVMHDPKTALDTWDYQWFYACLLEGLSVQPAVNLVSNRGFRPDATHTTESTDHLSNRPTADIGSPMIFEHPLHVLPDQAGDRAAFEHVFRKRRASLRRRTLRRATTLLHRVLDHLRGRHGA